MKEYVVHAKVKNNLLLSRILESGHSVHSFAAAYDVPYPALLNLVNLKNKAVRKDGEWRGMVARLAEILHVQPDLLFTEEQANASLATNEVTIELDAAEVRQIAGRNTIAALEDEDVVRRLMDCLTDRERDVVSRLADGETMKDVSAEYGVTHTRVSQIHFKSLRKMRERAKELGLTRADVLQADAQ